MKFSKILAACLVVAAVILSCKKENNTIDNVLNDTDNNFIRLAGQGNYTETETAKVALAKSTDSVVLSFAQQSFTNYNNAQSDLKTMGTIVGFAVTDTVDAAHAATVAQLDTLTGRTFDSAYIHTRLVHDQAMISFYSDELKNGKQINVRAYANTNLQSIVINQQRADSIAAAFY